MAKWLSSLLSHSTHRDTTEPRDVDAVTDELHCPGGIPGLAVREKRKREGGRRKWKQGWGGGGRVEEGEEEKFSQLARLLVVLRARLIYPG